MMEEIVRFDEKGYLRFFGKLKFKFGFLLKPFSLFLILNFLVFGISSKYELLSPNGPLNELKTYLKWLHRFFFLQNWFELVVAISVQIAEFIKNFKFTITLLVDFIAFLITIYMFLIGRKNLDYSAKIKKELTKSITGFLDTNTKVSVLIAARNEEKNIEKCVRSLMNQTYKNYEVLVMNDRSTDSTLEILKKLKDEYNQVSRTKGKLKYFTNSPLPKNWYGKSWAIQNLAKEAKGSVLMITDADTEHRQDSIRYCVHSLFFNNVDFVSGFPKQNLNSFGLKLIIPTMYIMSSYVIPLWLIDKTQMKDISLAIGQLMVVSKNVFNKVNGLEKVSNKICEDIQFARLLKALNYKTLFIDLEDHIVCNMYNSFKDAFLGLARNVFSAIDYSWTKYLFTTFIFGSILTPVISLLVWGLTTNTFINLLSILIFTVSWYSVLKTHQIPVFIAFCYPLMMVILFSVSLYSTIITFCTKGHIWKGRRVS